MGTSWNTEAIKIYAYQLGKRVARQRAFGGTPAYYLCGGLKLPAFPEWNGKKYPYAEYPYVFVNKLGITVTLYCLSKPIHANEQGGLPIFDGSSYLEATVSSLSGNFYEWKFSALKEKSEVKDGSKTAHWANYDVLNPNVTISEPIPVYEHK